MLTLNVFIHSNHNLFIDPLEQFEVVPAIATPNIITNMTLTLMLNLLVVYFLFFLVTAPYNSTRLSVVSIVVKKLYNLVKTVLKSNLVTQRYWYFNILFFLFFVILISNLVGLLPYSFTCTSSFVMTFWLALAHFMAVTLIGIVKSKWNFASNFLPSGVPLAVAPLLIPIELISYLARVFSLSIRLFANMMSGHALLKILLGFAWTMAGSGVVGAILAFMPWAITTAFMFLELLVAFVQAYVFVILITIYINDVINTH